MVIRRGSAAILLVGAGGVLSGCALPFAGPLAFSDILTGISIFSTATTGKGATELALDVMTGQDCRLLEGVLRDDRDFCEEPGSAATDEDFKGVVAWLEDDEPAPPLPGDDGAAPIMVADIGLPDATSTQPVYSLTGSIAAPAVLSDQPRTVALASLTELPDEWIVLASAQYDRESADPARIAPASGAPHLIRALLDASPLPSGPATGSSGGELADWAVEKMPNGAPGLAERALTMPPATAQGNEEASERQADRWNNLWPAVDIVNPPLQQDVLRPAVLHRTVAQSGTASDFESAPPPPAPAKPMLLAFLPHPKKPVLQAELDGQQKRVRLEAEFPLPAPAKPLPLPEDGPVLALLPSATGISRTK